LRTSAGRYLIYVKFVISKLYTSSRLVTVGTGPSTRALHNLKLAYIYYSYLCNYHCKIVVFAAAMSLFYVFTVTKST